MGVYFSHVKIHQLLLTNSAALAAFLAAFSASFCCFFSAFFEGAFSLLKKKKKRDSALAEHVKLSLKNSKKRHIEIPQDWHYRC